MTFTKKVPLFCKDNEYLYIKFYKMKYQCAELVNPLYHKQSPTLVRSINLQRLISTMFNFGGRIINFLLHARTLISMTSTLMCLDCSSFSSAKNVHTFCLLELCQTRKIRITHLALVVFEKFIQSMHQNKIFGCIFVKLSWKMGWLPGTSLQTVQGDKFLLPDIYLMIQCLLILLSIGSILSWMRI